jgi:DNA-directed RNA polymerase subunit RPC12/RpoP
MMSIRCPRCGREYDVTLFQFGKRVKCPCGGIVAMERGHMKSRDGTIEREIFESAGIRFADGRRAEAFRLSADRIVSLILHSDMPRIDIEIEIGSFRDDVLAEFPDRGELFDAIYLKRFERIWNQFRPGEGGLFDYERRE